MREAVSAVTAAHSVDHGLLAPETVVTLAFEAQCRVGAGRDTGAATSAVIVNENGQGVLLAAVEADEFLHHGGIQVDFLQHRL